MNPTITSLLRSAGSYAFPLVLVLAWFALQRWILPRFGVPT